MADFVIPKGKEYSFNVSVMEKDSFLPQSLVDNEGASILDIATFTLYNKDDMCEYGNPVVGTVVDALNGVLKFTLTSAYTSNLKFERGAKVDGYYLKPVYSASVEVTFTDGTEPVIALMDKVYVAPLGC